MPINFSRREFLNSAGLAAGAMIAPGSLLASAANSRSLDQWFQISVAQWSFQREFYSGAMTTRDFPEFCKSQLGIMGIDYLSDFMLDEYQNKTFQSEMKKIAEDLDISNLMIMCHAVGRIGHTEDNVRQKVLDDHYRWAEAAHGMGCSMMRVNPRSSGTRAQQLDLLAASLDKLCSFAADREIDIIIENGWGSEYAFKADFIVELIERVNMPNCGTLPDFGNFQYDNPYEGVKAMMPYAKSVSAKSMTFTPSGREKFWDYHRMLTIVRDSGYRGWVSIEYEGCRKAPLEGVLLTKELLLTEMAELRSGV